MYAPSPIEGVCRCYPPLLWNGNECIPKQQCPCMVGHIQYEIGAQYEADDCSKCVCVLGGQAQCKPQECPPCQAGLRPVKSATCMCLCEPCPNGQVLCPSSGACIPEKSWCDGVQDCPDDEINCLDKTKEGPKVVTKVEEKLSKYVKIPHFFLLNFFLFFHSNHKNMSRSVLSTRIYHKRNKKSETKIIGYVSTSGRC